MDALKRTRVAQRGHENVNVYWERPGWSCGSSAGTRRATQRKRRGTRAARRSLSHDDRKSNAFED